MRMFMAGTGDCSPDSACAERELGTHDHSSHPPLSHLWIDRMTAPVPATRAPLAGARLHVRHDVWFPRIVTLILRDRYSVHAR
jgi:hypothetical protein